ncbi:BLUF domain-containing protein [Aquimarina sp. TRL1]|uniref:BLUF domain-containing protein n=1 Tax=Aquimarina sp. (strain TRL1) TaxID=2736252 RepID=UPI00158DBB59|nr:BLUF domain-containing protein [Aquimarina sp. TRL1]QKX04800.1 BLUF domain-containing protein [Aquimarina sp. TRL1]
MKGIVYVSQAVDQFTPEQQKELSDMASGMNEQHGISGYLYYEKGYFLQYIEGEEKEMDQLFENISNDKRHKLLSFQSIDGIEERKFPSWHMHRLTKNSLIQIKMENILMDYLQYHEKNKIQGYNSSRINEDHIWEMVNKLSQFRNKLMYY